MLICTHMCSCIPKYVHTCTHVWMHAHIEVTPETVFLFLYRASNKEARGILNGYSKWSSQSEKAPFCMILFDILKKEDYGDSMVRWSVKEEEISERQGVSLDRVHQASLEALSLPHPCAPAREGLQESLAMCFGRHTVLVAWMWLAYVEDTFLCQMSWF